MYLSLAHHHDGVAQGEGFLLVVGYVDEGDAQSLVHLLQLQLHVLAHLQVEGSQWLVQEKNLRLVDDGAGDGDALLLSTRERVDVTIFVVAHVHHLQRTFHLRQYLLLRRMLEFEAEGDVVVHVEMWEQSIFLEHRIDVSLIRRKVGDVVAGDGDVALACRLKTSQESQ